MLSPFEFGNIVEKEVFVNRKEELLRLRQNYQNGVNTIIVSPRRWGKTSLVKKSTIYRQKEMKFVFIDMFNIRTEEDFYAYFAKKIITVLSSKIEDWMQSIKQLFKRITPKFSFGIDPVNDFEISFDYDEINRHWEEILNIGEHLARKKKVKLIICIDEFQNVGLFKHSVDFQRKLRAAWQHHKHVTYCLYGSKKHMLLDIFSNQSMPFYRFGEIFFLPKIKRNEWVKFVTKSFNKTNKTISKSLAEKICAYVDDHSYYVQQLSHLIWVKTVSTASEEILEDALNDLLNQNALFYIKEIESLSHKQLNFLKAVVSGVSEYTSQENLSRYNLGNSGSVYRAKEALESKEILDINGSDIQFIDPCFKLFLEHRYYNVS